MMIAAPPIVGVPRFFLWCCGPSSRISWPKPCLEKTLIRYGVNRMDTASATIAATRIAFTADAPRSRRPARAATRSRPAERDALTSTTSPSASSAARMATAASTSGTGSDSPAHDPSRCAPRCSARAPARLAGARDGRPLRVDRAGGPGLPRRPRSAGRCRAAPPAGRSRRARGPFPRRARPSRRAPPRCAGRGRSSTATAAPPHRVRVGVVRVVDEGHAAGQVGDLHPPAGRRGRVGEGRSDGLRRSSRRPGRRPPRPARCRPGGADHCWTCAPAAEPSGVTRVKRGAVRVVERDVRGPDLARRAARPTSDDARPSCAPPSRRPAGRRR